MHDSSHLPLADRQIALLIDADNVSHSKIQPMLAEITKYGVANIRRAYGDWTQPTLSGWRDRLHDHAIKPIQQFNYSKGKNATDISMVIDALELLYTKEIDAFCIASSDGDFTPLVMHLRAAGKTVYGFGKLNTPNPFVNACNTFLFLERLGDHESISFPLASTPAPESQPAHTIDAKILEALRSAVEASAGEDGWAPVSAAGSTVKRLAPIDPRNHGCKTFTQLFEKTDEFLVERAKNGQPWVADKRNTDRSDRPTA